MARRKWFLLVSMMVAVTFSAVAGGQSEKGPVTIKVMGWEPGGAEAWNKVVSMFEQKYPNIHVELEVVPIQGYFPVEGAHIAGQSGPDIMGNNCGFETWDRRAAYVDLNTYMTPALKNSVLDTNSDHLAFNPKLPMYGVSFSYQGNVMYYNKAILKEAGLDPNNPPKTWSEFAKAADAVKSIGKAPIGVGVGGTVAYWIFPEIAKNFWTSDQQIQDFAMGKIHWNDPVLADTLKYMAQMAQNGWFQKGAATINMQPDGFNVFLRGQAAFTPSIISDAFDWKDADNALGAQNVGAMLWPSIRPDAPFARKFSGVPGSEWGITKWSAHKKEAWEFLQFIISPEASSVWLSAGEQPLSTKFDAATSPFSNSPAFMQIQQIIRNPMVHTGVLTSSREADELSRGYQQVMEGQLTVAQWIDAMNKAQAESPLKNPNNPIWH